MKLRAALAAATVVISSACGSSDGGGIADVLVVARVEVTPEPVEVTVGQSVQLQAVPRTSTGVAIPGRIIAWSSGDPTVATVSSTGEVSGVAPGGPVSIKATVDGVSGEAHVTVDPTPVDHVVVTPDESGILVGQTQPLTAIALDAGGRPLTGRSFTWESNAPGVAAVTSTGLVLGIAPGGPVTISATTEGKTGTAAVSVSARPATRLAFVQQPGAARSGQPITPAVTVAVQDDQLNTVAGADNEVTISIAGNPGGATLSGTTVASAVNGIVTFNNLVLDRAGSGYTLMATSSGLSSATSTPFNVTAGTVTGLAITTQPSASAQSGAAFQQQPVVQLRDAEGNPVAQAGTPITAYFASGPAGASLDGTRTVSTGGSGTASFTDLAITGPAGTYTLLFGSPDISAVVSRGISLGAGAASRVAAASATTQSATVGTAVAAPPAVKVTDGGGNPVAGIAVSFAVTSGGGSVVPASPGTVSTDANGLAKATSWTLGTTAGTNNYAVTASAGGLTGSPVTFTASGVAGPGTQLTITTQPSTSAVSGTAFARQPVIQLRDRYGNPVHVPGVGVTPWIASGPVGVLGGTLAAVTDEDGAASFTDLKITGLPGNYTLGFSATGVTDARSGTITLSVALPAESGFGIIPQPPGGAASSIAPGAASVAEVGGAGGNPVPPLRHIPGENMMCALGVPGNITQGARSNGFSGSPVDLPVAKGMYTT
jgi:hypothetical protein